MTLTTPRVGLLRNGTTLPIATPEALSNARDSRPTWHGGLEYGEASRRGSYHPENEDSYLLSGDKLSSMAVADGVGGGARGKVASRVMIERIHLLTPALLANPTALRDWLLASDDIVAVEIARHTDREGAATFVAAVPSWGGRRWALTWAGDCRAYRISAGNAIQCLTRDDTYGNLSETAPEGAGPDDPARMVGNGAVDQANLDAMYLSSGEIIFLCSDGVHRFVQDEQLVSILRGTGSLEQRCRQLVAAAHQNGGHDDATVIAVERHRWFSVGEATWYFAIFGLLVSAASLAWQSFPHAVDVRSVRVQPATARVTPAAPFSMPPPAIEAPVPSTVLVQPASSGSMLEVMSPDDVAAPARKPPTPKHNATSVKPPKSKAAPSIAPDTSMPSSPASVPVTPASVPVTPASVPVTPASVPVTPASVPIAPVNDLFDGKGTGPSGKEFQPNLGNMHQYGKGAAEKEAEAVVWYRKATAGVVRNWLQALGSKG